MKTSQNHRQTKRAGFSLIEVMIAITCSSLIAAAAFGVQTGAMRLFQKNSGINSSHESTRKILDRLEREIQSAISIPALVGTDRDVLDTTGPAPGVAFLRQSGPLRRVAANALAGTNVITLDAASPAPVVGQRLLIPAYDIEGDIIAVSGNSVTLAASLTTDVRITNGSLNRNVVAVITDVVSYVVVNTDPTPGAAFKTGELREYQNASSNGYNLIARGITEPEPFGLPFNAVPNTVP